MKKALKYLISLLGFEIIQKKNKDNITINAFIAQKQLIKNNSPIIFDVGAHIGSITLLYRNIFKNSTIFSFEPFDESYTELNKNVEDLKNIFTIKKGLSNESGKSEFHSNHFAPTNSLLATEKEANTIWGDNILSTKDIIEIEITTIDEFIEKNAINKIDILKLDVQGAENLVLKGAEKSLQLGKIDLIYTEIILLPTYEAQSTFHEILSLMNDHNFTLYNIYNPSFKSNGQLRQIDAIFIQKNLGV